MTQFQIDKYQVTKELQKEDFYSIYEAQIPEESSLYQLKVFEFPEAIKRNLELILGFLKFNYNFHEPPPNQMPYHDFFICDQLKSFVIVYNQKVDPQFTLKKEILSREKKPFHLYEATYLFINILTNYSALVRKKNIKPFVFNTDQVIYLESNWCIDYISAMVQSKIQQNLKNSKLHNENPYQALGVLLLEVLYLKKPCIRKGKYSFQKDNTNKKDTKSNLQSIPINTIQRDNLNLIIKKVLSYSKSNQENNFTQELNDLIFQLVPLVDFKDFQEVLYQNELQNLWYQVGQNIGQNLLFLPTTENFLELLNNCAYFGNLKLLNSVFNVMDQELFLQVKREEITKVLFQAIYQGQLEIITLIEDQFKITLEDFKQIIQERVIYEVCDFGYLNILRYFVEQVKIDVALADKTSGKAILVWSATGGHLEIVQYLIEEAHVDPNQYDINTGSTPLIESAKVGNIDIVKYLIEKAEVDPNQKNNEGCTALIGSAINGHLEIVRYLIEKAKVKINQVEDMNYSALVHSAYQGHLDIVRYLIEVAKASPSEKSRSGFTPLITAAKNGKLKVVKYLIERAKVDPDQVDDHGWSPLIQSIMNHKFEVTRYLIEKAEADPYQPDNKGLTPLLISSRYGNLEAVKYLIEEVYVSPDQVNSYYGRTPLISSAFFGELEVIHYLIQENHIDINQTDFAGNNLLTEATDKCISIIRLLVEDKANFNIHQINDFNFSIIEAQKDLKNHKNIDYLESI